MRKTTLIALFLLIFSVGFAQQIAKQNVLIEVATGTWCWACPYASIAAEKLLHEGKDVLILKNSYDDDFATKSAFERITLYGTNIYPDTYFNGLNNFNGVPNDSDFKDRYNEEIAKLTSFALSATYTYTDNAYKLNVNTVKVADYQTSDLRLHVVLTESHIKQLWQNMMPTIDYSNRKMFPDINGTQLNFSVDSIQNTVVDVTLEENSMADNCQLIIFVQDYSTKEILQAISLPLANMGGENNVAIDNVFLQDTAICNNAYNTGVVIRNRGNQPLKNAELAYGLNGDKSNTYRWEGNLQSGYTDTIYLPELSAVAAITDTFKIVADMPNGLSDDDLSNNSLTYNINRVVPGPFKLFIKTNETASAFYWKILNNGELVTGKGGYANDIEITELIVLEDPGCYEFKFSDNDNWGSTELSLTDAYGRTLFHFDELMLERTQSFYFSSGPVAPVISCNIQNNATDVSIDTNIIVDFNLPIRYVDGSDIDAIILEAVVGLYDSNNQKVECFYSIDSLMQQIIIEPFKDLNSKTQYTLQLENIESYSGGKIELFTVMFTTKQLLSVEQSINNVRVYPNPATNNLNIVNSLGSRLIIYNLNGGKVFEQTINSNSFVLPVRDFNTGFYLVELNQNGDKQVCKIQIN